MKNIFFVIISFLLCTTVYAQTVLSDVKTYFNVRLDSIVSKYDSLSVDTLETNSENVNSAFARMFMRPTLYKSVLGKSCYENIGSDRGISYSRLDIDAKRIQTVDRLLLNLYKDNPAYVWATEDELRKEVSTENVQQYQRLSGISLNMGQPPIIPDNVTGELATKVVKPNYWRTSGSFGINFTQNYFSSNWISGGENTKNMLVQFEFKFNYNDKKKIQFDNILEAKLGFYTAPSDTVHSIKTNQDLLRFTTKFGYKSVKNLYYTVQAQVWTQFLPFYESNSRDYKSNFMAPFNANFSFGIDYKRSMPKWTLSVYLAPLSAYNYRFVRYGDLAVSHYGIRSGRHHFEDFGTKLEANATIALMKNISWKTRLYYYTTYSRVEHDWENTFSFSFNKYFAASIFIHTRFDDKSLSYYSDDYGYWQLKENMMLGLTYSW